MDALPDFVKLVESYGHIGLRIDKPEDVEPAIEESIKRKNDLVFMISLLIKPRMFIQWCQVEKVCRDDSCMSDIKTRHIIALLLENESGALSRVSGYFHRSYNIESLTVAPTDDSTLSRMTIVTYGTEDIVEQITKQLNN